MTIQTSKSKTTLKLLGVVLGMFVFGFALVPLYDIYCQVTGANGKTGGAYVASEAFDVDEERQVTVQFLTNNNANMPWEFRPTVRSMQVKPGQMYDTTFFASNIARTTMTAQAIPSVAPFHAAEYFHKTECFCFEQQQLASGEVIDMPLRFIIDPHLPASVKTLTLSYTLFDITDIAATGAAE
jgi:cytochrome c oxidase assembly protein subunit 11